MAKQRYINTKFWDDSYIVDLDPIEKLLFIYFLTNPLTTICGIYEISLKRIAFDTGIDKDMVLKILARFEADKKIKYENGWIAMYNFIKHQAINPKIEKGIEIGLNDAPHSLIEWINESIDSLSKPIHNQPKDSNYSNTNTNTNTNNNTNTATDRIKSKEIIKLFESIWNKYPNKDGRKDAIRHFTKDIKNYESPEKMMADINNALINYMKLDKVKNGYIKMGATWFNNWQDFINYQEPSKPTDDKTPRQKAVAERGEELKKNTESFEKSQAEKSEEIKKNKLKPEDVNKMIKESLKK